jgi:4-oxalocrotonate tautomerase
MPVIVVEMSGMTKEQKSKMVEEFTETTARIANMPKDTIIVFIKENSFDNIGMGGRLLSDRKS